MSQHISQGVRNLLLDQLGLGLGDGQVMTLAFISRQNRQQDNGEHGQNHAQERCTGLRECFVCCRRTGQSDNFRVDGVIAQQGRCGHGTQTGDERHDSQREHGGDQRGENHLPQHLEWLGTHVSGSFHSIVVYSTDGIAQEQRMV